MEDNLNANHCRALTAKLSLMGQMMHENLHQMDSTQKNVFVRHINPANGEEKPRIRSVINEIELFLQLLKEKYNLMEEVRDIQWMLMVTKSKALELLAETSPKRLQAAGALSPKMVHRLESDLKKLRRIIETLC